MRFAIHRNMLESSIQRVMSAVSSADMSHVGVRVQDETLELMMQDRFISVYSQSPCLAQEAGMSFVPAKLFADVVRELPDMDIEVSIEGARCHVKAGDSIELKLPVRADIQWIEPPALQEAYKVSLPAERLHYLVEQVNPCLDPKSNRNYATVGFLKQESPGNLRLVGTNGFRLSYAEAKLDMSPDAFSDGICLTRKALSEVQRMCGEGFDQVDIFVSDSDKQISLKVPGYQLFIKLSNVTYPNYRSAIPQKGGSQISLERRTLAGVIRRVLLAAGKSRGLHVGVKDGWMVLQTRDAGCSEGREIIPIPNAPDMTSGFAVNGSFLSDILSTVSCDTVNITTHGSDDPLIVVPDTEPANCHSRHMLMQIQEDYADSHGERND